MISEEQVRKIAQLARLTLEESEVPKFSKELSGLMDFVESLDKVDVTGLVPTAHAVEVQNVFREDVTKDAQVINKVIAQAPHADEGYFMVPKVVEK